MNHSSRALGHGCSWVTALALALGCSEAQSKPVEQRALKLEAGRGVVSIEGSWRTPELIKGWFPERAVSLTDLTAFVRRDPNLEPPEQQVLARLETGSDGLERFELALPIDPPGILQHFAAGDAGVKVFAANVALNVVGDTFMSPLEMRGWASELTSIVAAPGTREIIGGRIAVWAARGAAFPADFGADGLLFTPDDPLANVEPGWTVIDLDTRPFTRRREARMEVNILNGDMQRDLASLGYVGAYDALVAELEQRYPYSVLKELDWSAIRASIRPRIVAAEVALDAAAFHAALSELAVLMQDGHAAVYPPSTPRLIERHGGGVGLRLGQDDAGAVYVTELLEESAAAAAGIERGAEILAWNDAPVAAALEAAALPFPESSPHGVRAMQLRVLPRLPIDARVVVGYRNPGAPEPASVELVAVEDFNGLSTTFGEAEPGLPVRASVLPSGIGYLRVATFDEDVTLLTHAWEWSLEQLLVQEVPSLILDLRGNPGGVNQPGLYFAGSFYAEPILRSRRFAHAASGEAMWTGDDVIEPSPLQWDRPVAVLIDEGCVSVCEEFAATMALDPEHLIVGSSASAGIEADVRFWALPDGLLFFAPLAFFRHPDGTLFVEGKGVDPTLRVPVTRESLLSADDEVLDAAIEALGNAP